MEVEGEIDDNLSVQPTRMHKLFRPMAPYVEKTAITFEYEVPSVQESLKTQSAIQIGKIPYLVAEEDGQVLSLCLYLNLLCSNSL